MDIINKYFEGLTDLQKKQFAALDALYRDWNSKINVISRKDIDNLYTHHILHSLGIAKVAKFAPGTKLMDFGTGGGFPGIPLAILFPESSFHLIDSIGKKVRVAQEVATAIGLTNCTFNHCRAQDEKRLFNFVISRAVMSSKDLMEICKKNIMTKQDGSMKNGIICLKGGDLKDELKGIKGALVWDLNEVFDEPFFETKKVVYIPGQKK